MKASHRAAYVPSAASSSTVGAHLGDAAMVQHHDAVGAGGGGEPVRHATMVASAAVSSLIARFTAASAARSSAAVASSSSKMAGSASWARASAMSWRWPADRLRPRSATSCS